MERPPEEVLPMLARAHLDSFDDPVVIRLLRISLSEAALDPEASNQFIREARSAVSGFFVAYLRRQVELGRLRGHDLQSSARSFLGMLLVYILSREVFLHFREGLPDKERYVTSSTFSWTGYARIKKGQP